jgi:ubiquinone/menaquinone biosynthesis C-methylase UbiE
MPGAWNHNINYHDVLLTAVPAQCSDALDVGCGDGMFARRLAKRAGNVIGIDRSPIMIETAMRMTADIENVRFITGDFLGVALPENGLDYVSCLTALHHMDFVPAIQRMRCLLRTGGVLAILGVARDRSPRDFAMNGAAVPINRMLRLRRGWYQPPFSVERPTMSHGQVRTAAAELLPGAELRRLLLFRYLVLWRKP